MSLLASPLPPAPTLDSREESPLERSDFERFLSVPAREQPAAFMSSLFFPSRGIRCTRLRFPSETTCLFFSSVVVH